MKFSNFLFPQSDTPDTDHEVVTDALREAELTEELGFDGVWLGEHHNDGACAYVDPVTFAAAVAARTERVKIGFAAVQMALHHPIRLAEQIALLDNISKGESSWASGAERRTTSTNTAATASRSPKRRADWSSRKRYSPKPGRPRTIATPESSST